MTDLSKNIAQAYLNKTAGRFMVQARIGTQKGTGARAQQEMWLYTTIPGSGKVLAWEDLEEGKRSLDASLVRFKKNITLEGAKIGHVGQVVLVDHSRMEIALRIDQTNRSLDSVLIVVNNALWRSGVEKGR